MGLVRTRKTLADATVTSGAHVAAASGGRPQRITTGDDVVLVGILQANGAVIFDPDGLHVWVTRPAANQILKVLISTGATITTISSGVSTPQGITRAPGSTKAYVACAGNNTAIEIDLLTGTPTSYTCPVAAPCHVVQGSAGKAWARTGITTSGVYSEFTLATGVATGRVTSVAGFELHYFPASSRLVLLTNVNSVLRIDEPTNVTDLTWTNLSNTVFGVPKGGAALRAMALDSSARPVVADTQGGGIYRYAAASNAVDKRLFYSGGELGQPAVFSTAFARSWLVWSDDDSKAAWVQYNSAGGAITGTLDVRVVDLRTARARWAFASANPVTVQEIAIPGAHGNLFDAVVTPPGGQPTTVYDYRRARFYWSINGGGARTEFLPGDDLAIAVAGGGTLTVDADMSNLEQPLATLSPWVGGSAGEGIGVVWEDPLVGGGVVTPTPPGGAITATTFETIRDNYYRVIRALVPRRLQAIKFDFVDDEMLTTWAERMPSSTLFRKCEFLEVGDKPPQSQILEPNAQERMALCTFTVAYPVLENLVGREKYRELEDVMRDDAAMLHDALFWSGNYVSGQSACFVTISPPTRVSSQLYIQTLSLQVDFYEATRLGV